MSSCKKPRAENFMQKEELFLLRVVKLKATEIESKKTDANNLKIKSDAWAQVTAMFNCHSGEPHRDTDALRNKYNNIRKRAKAKFSEEKNVEFVFESSKQNDWSNYNPDMLKTPIAKELQTATCETREKHQQYIDLQEKESEQRLRLQKEKHELEMKILRQQNSNIV
ncbi:hypothetical protein FQA39_LY16973 [Lamprigera yunnana]|nr:hypothetical protein FQA39_LY16973 [Lamprigera yunnana]